MWNSNNNGFAGLLGRAGSYGPEIQAAARRYGIPPEVLLSIGKIESNFNPRAVGPQTRHGTAKGMFQFIDGTAQDMGLSNSFDWRASADASARYLRQLYGQFGDWGMAAAAYNAGPGNIKKWGRDPSRWPAAETRNYYRQFQDLVGGGLLGPAFDGAALPPPTVAPSAGDGSADSGQGFGQGEINPMHMGLLGAGLNMLTGNTGGASLGQLLGHGLTGAINAYGGALAAQQDQKRQGIDDQLKMMELSAKLREAENAQRQGQAYQTMEQTMSPVEYAKFIINPLEAIKGDREDWSHFDSSDDYGNKRSGLLNKRTGEIRYPGEGGQPAMDSLPPLLQEGMAVGGALRNPAGRTQAEQTPQAGGQGQVFTMDGQPVNAPAGARWQKPELTHLPDGTPVMRQYDTIGRHYRDMPAYDPKQAEAAQKAEILEAIKSQAASLAFEDIGRAKDIIQKNPTATGFGSESLAKIAGSSAHNLSALLVGLKSYVARETLQNMRDASPTGGALGNVSNLEVEMLMSAYGSLSQSQSKAQLLTNLSRFEGLLKDVIHKGVKEGSAPASGVASSGTPNIKWED